MCLSLLLKRFAIGSLDRKTLTSPRPMHTSRAQHAPRPAPFSTEDDLKYVDRRGYVGGQKKEDGVGDDALDEKRNEEMRWARIMTRRG